MRFRWRKSIGIGPIRLRFSNGHYTGWGVRVGPLSWTPRTGRWSVNTPGVGYVTGGGRRRGRR